MKINVTKYAIEPQVACGGTKGSFGVETMEFTFDSAWEGLSRTVTFFPPGTQVKCVPLTSDALALPPEVTARPGRCPYVLCGTRQGAAIMTLTAVIEVCDTVAPTEDELSEHTPGALAAVTGLCSDARECAQTAAAAAQSAAASADGAQTAKECAEQARDAILERGEILTLRRVSELPAVGMAGALYLVPSDDGETGNAMDEYIFLAGEGVRYAWEVGMTASPEGGIAPQIVYSTSELPDIGDPLYVTPTGEAEGHVVNHRSNGGIVGAFGVLQGFYSRIPAQDVPAVGGWERVGIRHADLAALERTENRVTALGELSTDEQYPSAKAVVRAIDTAIDAAIKEQFQMRTGVFCNYYRPDLKYDDGALRVCVKPISERYVGLYFDYGGTTAEQSLIFEWYFTVGETAYRVYTNNFGGGYLWFGQVPGTAVARENTAVYDHTSERAFEFRLDLQALPGIAQQGEFRLDSVIIYDGSWNTLVHRELRLPCIVSDQRGALVDAMRAIAAATSVRQISVAANAFLTATAGVSAKGVSE